MNPLRELRSYLGSFAARCGEAGWWGAALHVRAVEQIAGDVQAQHAEVAAKAYANEQAAVSLAEEIRGMIADGMIDAAELRRLRLAPKILSRCAERSHDIAEATS